MAIFCYCERAMAYGSMRDAALMSVPTSSAVYSVDDETVAVKNTALVHLYSVGKV